MTEAGRVARVLLDTPLPQLDHPFDYRIPEALDEAIQAGVRVTVPLRGGTRFVDGFVIERTESPEFPGELGDVASVVSPIPVLTQATYSLARAVADRQAGSVIDVLRMAIPPRFVRAEKAYLAAQLAAQLAAENVAEQDVEKAPGPEEPPAPGFALSPEPEPLIAPPPTELTGFATWNPLGAGKYVVGAPAHLRQTRLGDWVPAWATLFAELAGAALARGESSILAVPDFRDIDVVVTALEAAGLSDSLARVDSRQSGQQRYLTFLRCLEPHPSIIVGNRSAPLAPAHNLSLIALWDDGDENFCEPLAPYAHARDVALVRQQATGATLVLAGHTRSTEAQRLVSVGWAQEVFPDDGYAPRISQADQQTADLDERHARIPAPALLAARSAAKTGPVLVQVSSPGYAAALACTRCRERARCNHCSGPLQTTRKGAPPTCRWCGLLAAMWACPACNNRDLKPLSPGSEGTAEDLGRAFPGVKIIVADGTHAIQRVDDTPALVIATPGAEPLADGGYRAVLLIDGERLRMRENLRVNEDVIRHWSNAAALASTEATVFLIGAGEQLGRVMTNWGQADFAKNELADRHALRLPPAVRVVSVTGPLADVTDTCHAISHLHGVRVLGPVGMGEGRSRAVITFDYRDGDMMATSLRASVIQSATRGSRRAKRPDQPKRVLRLRVRFDDTDIDSL